MNDIDNEGDMVYLDNEAHGRAPVVWRVQLTMVSTVHGYVDVGATTQEEAAQIADEMAWPQVQWDWDRHDFDDSSLGVCCMRTHEWRSYETMDCY